MMEIGHYYKCHTRKMLKLHLLLHKMVLGASNKWSISPLRIKKMCNFSVSVYRYRNIWLEMQHWQVKVSWNADNMLSRNVSQLGHARASVVLLLIKLFPSSITKCIFNKLWNSFRRVCLVCREELWFMALPTFPSSSFSSLLHDATPCGLSNEYPD